MIIQTLSLYQYIMPLDPPLPVAKQRITERQGLVLSVTAQDHQHQTSANVEISPLSGNDDKGRSLTGFSQESLNDVTDFLEQSLINLLKQPIISLNELATVSPYPSVAFGLSLLYQKLLKNLPRLPIDKNSIALQKVPLIYIDHVNEDISTQEIEKKINLHLSQCNPQTKIAKMKVGQFEPSLELTFIYAILNKYPSLILRLDANQAFTLEEAIEFASCLPKANIQYIEEPCQDLADCAKFFAITNIPFALDETLNEPSYEFSAIDGLQALVLKPMLIGHIDKLTDLILTAQHAGILCSLSSSLETSLGISDLALLAHLLTPDSAPGLDTLYSFQADLFISSGKTNCLTEKDLKLIVQIG